MHRDSSTARANAPRPTLAMRLGGCRTSQTTPSSRNSATWPWCAAPTTRWSRLKSPHPQHALTGCCMLAESDGRRESLLDFPARQRRQPAGLRLAGRIPGQQRNPSALPPPLSDHRLQPGWKTAWTLVTETELFAAGPTARRRNKKQEQVSDVEALIKDLAELNVGDPVVHSRPRHRPLPGPDQSWTWARRTRTANLHCRSSCTCEYADKAVLYVPVSQLQQISRYTGVSADEAPLHKPRQRPVGKSPAQGRRAGARRRRRAAEHLRPPRRPRRPCLPLLAARLRGLCRRFRFRGNRRPERRHPRRDPGHDQPAPDGPPGLRRRRLWQDRSGPARRLHVAVTGGKQVALLAPTTLLAEQHYQTLVDRFAKWPVKVAEVSRFRSGKEVNAALKGLADGSVDIVVGTHKLLSESTHFKNLGLLIIDEEHRFGVRHKEQMKALRAEVDVLTLTATPIPRTLGMALEGLRDLSVIATAPQRRLAIKTFVRNEGNLFICYRS
jgi:transcription-repair coupling factor (superfamily II helicase)